VLETRYIGRRHPRVEDRPLVRGAGRFVDDLNPPGLVEAAFLRSKQQLLICCFN
jgi:CO/xanthine dehydrogenase Mo-binding subunit